jgi:hypothetical protein
VIQNAGFGMAFQTPYLFEQWGSTLAVVAGVCWFGLFCPLMGFMDGMRDLVGQNKGAWFWSNDFSFRFTNSYF